MKVGAEDRKKLVIAGVLMAAALLLVARTLLEDSGPSASPPSFAQSNSLTPQAMRAVSRRMSGKGAQAPTLNLDPRLRLDLLKGSEDVTYAGTGRNIFLSYEQEPIPAAIRDPRLPNGKVAGNTPPPPTGPPPPPPITLKFFGFANKPGQPKKVFLAKGQDVFIAGEGDIVDRRYKVLRIGPTSIELQDVLNNNRQSIPITPG